MLVKSNHIINPCIFNVGIAARFSVAPHVRLRASCQQLRTIALANGNGRLVSGVGLNKNAALHAKTGVRGTDIIVNT